MVAGFLYVFNCKRTTFGGWHPLLEDLAESLQRQYLMNNVLSVVNNSWRSKSFWFLRLQSQNVINLTWELRVDSVEACDVMLSGNGAARALSVGGLIGGWRVSCKMVEVQPLSVPTVYFVVAIPPQQLIHGRLSVLLRKQRRGKSVSTN